MDCDFGALKLLLNKDPQLSINKQLKIFDHLETCQICQSEIYKLAKKRDTHLTMSYSKYREVATRSRKKVDHFMLPEAPSKRKNKPVGPHS